MDDEFRVLMLLLLLGGLLLSHFLLHPVVHLQQIRELPLELLYLLWVGHLLLALLIGVDLALGKPLIELLGQQLKEVVLVDVLLLGLPLQGLFLLLVDENKGRDGGVVLKVHYNSYNLIIQHTTISPS